MKKNHLSFAICCSAVLAWSCNDSSNTAGSGSDTGTTSSMNADTMNSANTGNTGSTTNNNVNTTPLTKDDSTFVMEAAIGGMSEVQMGNLAQQKATNQRVKDFGAMMVRDHSKANDELSSYASSHGMTLPTALPADKQMEMDQMNKLTGKAFDQHYVNMMVDDHKKDVAKFKMKSTGANDATLKAWAGQTLPVLQMHLDSIQSIKKMKW